MIKPDGLKHMGEIMVMAEEDGFAIQKVKLTRLTKLQAEDFYQEHRDRSFFEDLVGYITSGPVLAMELMRSNAVLGWRSLLGPTDATKARDSAPNSVRAKFGTDKTENAAHGSDSKESAARVCLHYNCKMCQSNDCFFLGD